MISIECECGKVLKIKDELAGKKVRCPVCMATVSVPAADTPPGDEWDNWDELGDAGAGAPVAPASSSKARKRQGKKRTGGGLKWGVKAIVGMMAIVIGAAIGFFICYSFFTGNGNARMLRGLVMPVVFIGFGISWIKGETFGK